MDMSEVPIYQPPSRFTEKDPTKFHPCTKKRFPGGWMILFFNKPYYIGGETIYGIREETLYFLVGSNTIFSGRVDLNLKVPLVAEEVKVTFKGFERVFLESTVNVRDGDNFGHY